jgi:hypothetical protein
MLNSEEYAEIKADYDRVSRTHFAKQYFFPEGMSFAKSDALFPPADLAMALTSEYEAQVRMLCYGVPPTWDDVLRRFWELRSIL